MNQSQGPLLPAFQFSGVEAGAWGLLVEHRYYLFLFYPFFARIGFGCPSTPATRTVSLPQEVTPSEGLASPALGGGGGGGGGGETHSPGHPTQQLHKKSAVDSHPRTHGEQGGGNFPPLNTLCAHKLPGSAGALDSSGKGLRGREAGPELLDI